MVYVTLVLLQFVFIKMRLPCSVHVHRTTGLEEGDDHIETYASTKKDPWRFNVDQNVSGNTIKYHGRF